MQNPVLVEMFRGGRVESRHRGSLSVLDADGKVVVALGDGETPIFPRSAIKALQALPMLESGAVEKFALTEAEIALACASHSGEPLHAKTALNMLQKAGQPAECLECGAHWPMREAAARELAAGGASPTALHNNCSGKHAGFVCLACATGHDPKHYIQPGHFVQREVRAALEAMTGFQLDPASMGTDGCSIPAWAFPLKALALAFARFGTGHGLAPIRKAAARKICESVAAHPFMVAGTGRFDTGVMEILGQRAFTKTGAEGVFCASLPEQGLGVALKMDDGATRGAEIVMASVLWQLVALSEAERSALQKWAEPRLINWNGLEVGQGRATAPLASIRP